MSNQISLVLQAIRDPRAAARPVTKGPKFQQGLARVCREVNVEIVWRCDTGKFIVLPRRWIVERTIAWLNRCRRLSKVGSASTETRWHSCAGRQFD